MKYLLLILVLFALALIWRQKGRRPSKPEAPPAIPESMLRCAHCAVNFPASEQVSDGTDIFCCDAHRRAGPRKG